MQQHCQVILALVGDSLRSVDLLAQHCLGGFDAIQLGPAGISLLAHASQRGAQVVADSFGFRQLRLQFRTGTPDHVEAGELFGEPWATIRRSVCVGDVLRRRAAMGDDRIACKRSWANLAGAAVAIVQFLLDGNQAHAHLPQVDVGATQLLFRLRLLLQGPCQTLARQVTGAPSPDIGFHDRHQAASVIQRLVSAGVRHPWFGQGTVGLAIERYAENAGFGDLRWGSSGHGACDITQN